MKSSPIFVKPRNDQGNFYDSYDIISQLIDWNFDWCELDAVDPDSSNTYIFILNNGNVKACCDRPHKAKYILWQLEITYDPCPPYFNEQWVSDRTMNGKFVILGGDLRLYKPKEDVKWDFAVCAYLYGKRARQIAELEQKGFTIAPSEPREMRDEAIARSKWGLCLHQLDQQILSPQRMTLFACRKLPIVLEQADSYPYKVCYLHNFDRQDLSDNAEENFTMFTQIYTFKKVIEGAL